MTTPNYNNYYVFHNDKIYQIFKTTPKGVNMWALELKVKEEIKIDEHKTKLIYDKYHSNIGAPYVSMKKKEFLKKQHFNKFKYCVLKDKDEMKLISLYDELPCEIGDCPVCFDNKLVYTGMYKCKHQFCKPCALEWNETCPICRSHGLLYEPPAEIDPLHMTSQQLSDIMEYFNNR